MDKAGAPCFIPQTRGRASLAPTTSARQQPGEGCSDTSCSPQCTFDGTLGLLVMGSRQYSMRHLLSLLGR
jgi:hypothetical protein